MSNYFLFITLLPIFPTYWGYVTRNGTEHYKAMMTTFSLIIAQSVFLGYVLFNEYAPGFIYAGTSLYQEIAYDGISLTYLLVSTILTGLCIISLCEYVFMNNNLKESIILMLLLESVLFNFFITRDLFYFYVWFEAALPILFLIVLLGGERNVRIRASLMLFIYTLFFSMITLCTIVYLNQIAGSSDLFELLLCDFSLTQQFLIYLGFLLGFAVKVPSSPVHVWLPHAHVEANTVGSVLLAGIILKMGGYAIVRLLLPMCPNMYNDYGAFGSVLGYMSVINTSLIIVTEPDLKRLIAYFSIVHMNISIIGLFAGEKLAILGAIGMMVSHSLIASALFFCIGVLYERYQTRDTTYYGGLANASINFAIVFFLFILSNFSFPLTFGFWPEVLVLTGLALVSYLDVIVILISSIFSLASNLILYTRVFFSIPSRFITKYADLTRFEMFLLCPLMIFNIYYGVHPQAYLIFIDLPVNFLLTACSITL